MIYYHKDEHYFHTFRDDLANHPISLPSGFDLETCNFQGLTALDPLSSTISLAAVCLDNKVHIFDCLALGGIPTVLKEYLEDPERLKVIQNVSFEYKLLIGAGVELQGYYCTMIAEQDLKRGLGLANNYGALVQRYTGVELPKDQGASDWAKRPLTQKQIKYVVNDVYYLPKVYEAQQEKYKKTRGENQDEPSEMELNYRVEMEALPIFCETELNGVYFNPQKAEALLNKYTEKAASELHAIQRLLPPVPLTKSDAAKRKMREIYPDGVKPPTSNNDFKRALKAVGVVLPTTTDKETGRTRESLSASTYHLITHPAGSAIQAYTATKKLVTSYLNKMTSTIDKEGWIHPLTKRSHPHIRQNGTDTSRPAYNDPPLQTIPKLEDFRETVEAESKQWVLLKADYSQIELRVGAVVANDPVMIQAFKAGEDLHILTASNVLGIPKSKVGKADRQKAKACNFGLLFDQSAMGFQVYAQTQYGVEFTLDECRSFKRGYLKQYQGVSRFQRKVKDDTVYSMFYNRVYTGYGLTGRRRYWRPGDIPMILKEGCSGEDIQHYYTICKDAINFPIQNGNAECMKRAMILLNKELVRVGLRAKIILQVHDEMVLEVHVDDLKEAAKILYHSMLKAANIVVNYKVPIEVELSVGRDWANTKVIKVAQLV